MPIIIGCVSGCKPDNLLLYSYMGFCPTSKPKGRPVYTIPTGDLGCFQQAVNSGYYVVWCDAPCNQLAAPCPLYVPPFNPETGGQIIPVNISCDGVDMSCTAGRLQINDTALDGDSPEDAINMVRDVVTEHNAYTVVMEWVLEKRPGEQPVSTVKGGYVIDMSDEGG
jgi:hypothetical protein